MSLERLAINSQNTGRSDNQGNTPEQDVIEPSGDAAYFSNIDPHPLVEALTREGIQAYVSYHAGIYGCNWLFYNMMRSISQGKHDIKAIFIHLPPFPEQALEKSKMDMATMSRDLMTKGLEIVIQNLPQ
jgi:pyroglutamyl-peptidase